MNFDLDLTAILIVSIVFICSASIVATVMFFVHRSNEQKHQTIRLALEKGQPLPPELLESGRNPTSDLLKGIKLTFTGLGLGLFFFFFMRHLWPIGLIVLFVGLGHLVAHAVTRTGRTATPPVG
jgi:hypothetical protein